MYPCTRAARQQWRRLGGPVMPADWWLEAETREEALAKLYPHPFNREGAVSYYKAEAKILNQPTPVEKENRAKALEWQRQKDEKHRVESQFHICSSCNKNLTESEYSSSQWMRRRSKGAKCKGCIPKRTAERKQSAGKRETTEKRKRKQAFPVEEEKKVKKRKPEDSLVDGTAAQVQEDLSILTVVQLKDRLRGLNLAVGGRKQELIDRLNGHPNLAENEQVGNKHELIDRLKTNAAKVKRVTSVYQVAKRRQGFTFTITKPETGKFGLIVCDLKVSYGGDINCTTRVTSIALGAYLRALL